MPRDHRGDFGTYVGVTREEAGLTGTQVAGQVGIRSQSVYSDMETGKTIPSDESVVRRIASAIGVDPDMLVRVWERDVRARQSKTDPIVQRAYNVTSTGGGTTEDPY